MKFFLKITNSLIKLTKKHDEFFFDFLLKSKITKEGGRFLIFSKHDDILSKVGPLITE